MKVISNIIILLCILINFSYGNPSASSPITADQTTAVAALVADQVISVYDLKQRIQLIVNSQARPLHRDEVHNVIPVALQELIDEKLLDKEATKNYISITEDEIQQLIDDLCRTNHIPRAQFAEVMKSKNIPIDTLKSQLKGQLLKSKIISEVILPKMHVTEKEIYETLHTNASSEININLKKVFINFTDEKDLDKKRRATNDLRAKAINCTNLDQIISKYPAFTIESQYLKATELQDPVRNEILNTEVNKSTKIIKTKTNLQFYTICSKEYIDFTPKDKNNIHEMLMQNKLSIQINLYLTQLRKRNHVNIKAENLQHLTFPPNFLHVL